MPLPRLAAACLAAVTLTIGSAAAAASSDAADADAADLGRLRGAGHATAVADGHDDGDGEGHTVKALACSHLCDPHFADFACADMEAGCVAQLCRCVNWHGYGVAALGDEIGATCGAASDSKAWWDNGGQNSLGIWAKQLTGQVCAGVPGSDCSFDAAVRVFYDKGLGNGDRSGDLQCAFALQGYSMDSDPNSAAIFGHPARRKGHSGLSKNTDWTPQVQTILDAAQEPFFPTAAGTH